MTYNEAKKQLEDNWDKSNPHNTNKNSLTPHQVVALIVCPTDCDDITKQAVRVEVYNNKKDNADVLIEMDLFSMDLNPYVSVLIGGKIINLLLDTYLSSPTFFNKS